MPDIAYTPAQEPLGHTAPLDHRTDLPIMGLPFRFRSNCAAVIAAVEEAYGFWRDLDESLVSAAHPIHADIVVHAHAAGDFPDDIAYRLHGGQLILSRSPDMLVANIDHGTARAFITPESAADGEFLTNHVLPSLGLTLATGADRHPVHAACVVGASKPAILAAESGVGKSSLCYACLRGGFAFLADDSVFISTTGVVRAWQAIRTLRLPADLTRRHPELERYPAKVESDGRRKIALTPADMPDLESRLCAERPVTCLLRRSEDGTSALEPVSSEVAVRALATKLAPGFDMSRDPVRVAETLAECGCYSLRVGSDPSETVAVLHEITA